MGLNNVNFVDFHSKINKKQNANTKINLPSQKPDEFVSRPKDENKPEKKFSKKATVFLLSAASILATSIFLLKKRKISSLVDLGENIEFKRAKTLQEAVEFGKNTLKIDKYRGFTEDDLDVLNWFNEGIVNTSKRMKGKMRVPKVVQYAACEGETIASAIPYSGKIGLFSGEFRLNKNIFSNLDDSIKKSIDVCINDAQIVERDKKGLLKCTESLGGMFSSKEANEIVSLLNDFEQGKKLSFNEKVRLYNLANSFAYLPGKTLDAPFIYAKKILSNKTIQEVFKKDKREEFLKSFEGKTNKEQFKKLMKLVAAIEKKTGIKIKFAPSIYSEFQTIYHEMGHLQDMVRRTRTIYDYKDASKYPKELLQWLNDDKNLQVATSVSPYASSGPGEFIAETFAEIIEKGSTSDEAMKLYEKLDGPKIPA